jgi:transcription factor IIIB subunit 2
VASCSPLAILRSNLGKRIMNQLAQQLQIQETTVTEAVQILKLAVMHNFIHGRRTEMVCAVCLYTACRMTQPCRVMLIDFADKISVSFPRHSFVHLLMHV